MDPGEKPLGGVLRIRQNAQRRVGQSAAGHGRVVVLIGARWGLTFVVDDVVAPGEPERAAHVPVSLDRDRADPRLLETLRNERILVREPVEVTPVAMGFRRVFSDQQRTQALARVRCERVGAVEHHRARRERVDVGGHRFRVPGETEVGSQRVDGDQDDVETLRQEIARLGCSAVLRGGGRGGPSIAARTVFVDAVAGDILRPRVDVRVAIVAVPAAEERAVPVVVAVRQATQQRDRQLTDRRALLDRARDLRLFTERDRGFEREHQRRHGQGKSEQRGTSYQMGQNVRAQANDQEQRRRSQVELGALHHAPDP